MNRDPREPIFGRVSGQLLVLAMVLAGVTHHMEAVARLAVLGSVLLAVNLAQGVPPLRSAVSWAWRHRWRGWTWWLGAIWFVGVFGWLMLTPPDLTFEGLAFWAAAAQILGFSLLSLLGLVLGGLADAAFTARRMARAR